MSIIDNDKHTPGPWVSHAEVAGVIYGQDGHQVCTTPRTTRRETERDANARLIAAAPELLSALRELVEAVAPAVGGLTLEDWAIEPVAAADAAIAKATGQEVTP